MRRRSFLILTAATAATAASAPTGAEAAGPAADPRAALVENLRDAMLGLSGPHTGSGSPLPKQLARVQADYAACRYTELSRTLPAFMRAAHAEGDVGMMAQAYLSATRMLVKVDDHALGWMAADRARQLASQHDDALLEAEADQQLVVLCRRSGWTDRALSIAVNAADNPRLARVGPAGTAMRGLLLSSATYTVSKTGDRSGMRQLSGEAAALAADFDSKRVHVGGYSGDFSSATVQLYQIAAEFSAGDPRQALDVAKKLRPADLPTIERRARYWADVAAAQAHLNDRDGCLQALLAAERQAPEETYSRPAVRALITGLLVSGRTTSDMRALAARSRVSA